MSEDQDGGKRYVAEGVVYNIPKIYVQKKSGRRYIKIGKKKRFLKVPKSMTNKALYEYVKKNFAIKKKKKQKAKPTGNITNRASVTIKNGDSKQPIAHVVTGPSRLDPEISNEITRIRNERAAMNQPVQQIPQAQQIHQTPPNRLGEAKRRSAEHKKDEDIFMKEDEYDNSGSDEEDEESVLALHSPKKPTSPEKSEDITRRLQEFALPGLQRLLGDNNIQFNRNLGKHDLIQIAKAHGIGLQKIREWEEKKSGPRSSARDQLEKTRLEAVRLANQYKAAEEKAHIDLINLQQQERERERVQQIVTESQGVSPRKPITPRPRGPPRPLPRVIEQQVIPPDTDKQLERLARRAEREAEKQNELVHEGIELGTFTGQQDVLQKIDQAQDGQSVKLTFPEIIEALEKPVTEAPKAPSKRSAPAPERPPRPPERPFRTDAGQLKLRPDTPIGPKGFGEQEGLGGGLYSSQIITCMSKVPGGQFIGCIASDQFDTLLKRIKPHTRVGFISNLDNSHQSGSHWVAIILNGKNDGPDPHSVMYFDPFGEDINPEMQKSLAKLAEKIDPNELMKFKISRIQHQNVKTENCGYHSMLFLMNILSRNKTFADASGFKDVIKNESGKYEKEIEKLKDQAPFDYVSMKGAGEADTVAEIKEPPVAIPTAPKQEKNVVDRAADRVNNTLDNVDKVLSLIPAPRDKAPPKFRKFLEDHKGDEIMTFAVYRKPIFGIIQKTINFLRKITFRKLPEKDKQYDKLFHLYTFMQLKDEKGKLHNIKMERNQTFEVSESLPDKPDQKKGIEAKNVGKVKIKFGELINKAVSANKLNFWVYDSIENNCQDMVISLLKAGNVLTDALQKFIKQDVKSLLPKFITNIGKKVTDAAHGVDVLINGEGKKKPEKKKIGRPKKYSDEVEYEIIDETK